jgi:tetratricopeptide (TPR) repeat protein
MVKVYNRTPYLAAAGLCIGLIALWVWLQQPAAPTLPAAPAQISRIDRIVWSYQEIVAREPENLDAAAALGWAYLQKARESGDPSYYAKADAVLQAALRRDPQHVDALVGAGTLALARHQFARALDLGERARTANPHAARIYGVIADAQIELGMYDTAIETIQTMVDLRPDLSSYSRVAYARELYGDLDGAIEAMDRAVRAGGPTTENTEWARVQLGNLYLAKGDLASAERSYRATLARLPEYGFALAGMARIHAARGEFDAAIALYRQAIARMPLPEFVIALGETYAAAGMTADAARQYELVGAMQQLNAANGVDSDLELALFASDHGDDPEAALALARRAYAQRPGIRGAEALAWALYRAGEHTEARRMIDEALRLGTRDALLLYRAGAIAYAQGDTAGARRLLTDALTLNPHFSLHYAPQAQATLAALDAAATGDVQP